MLAVKMLVRFRLPYPQYSRLSDMDITAPCILKMLVNTAPLTMGAMPLRYNGTTTFHTASIVIIKESRERKPVFPAVIMSSEPNITARIIS